MSREALFAKFPVHFSLFTFCRSLFSPHPLSFAATRTGVRVAEGAGLENRCTGNGTVGSNPTLSVAPGAGWPAAQRVVGRAA